MRKILIAACVAAGCSKAPTAPINEPVFDETIIPKAVGQANLLRITPVDIGKYKVYSVSNELTELKDELTETKLSENGKSVHFVSFFYNLPTEQYKFQNEKSGRLFTFDVFLGEESLDVLVYDKKNKPTFYPEKNFLPFLQENFEKTPKKFKIFASPKYVKIDGWLDDTRKLFSNVISAYYIPYDENDEPIGKGKWGQIALGIAFDTIQNKMRYGICLIRGCDDAIYLLKKHVENRSKTNSQEPDIDNSFDQE